MTLVSTKKEFFQYIKLAQSNVLQGMRLSSPQAHGLTHLK